MQTLLSAALAITLGAGALWSAPAPGEKQARKGDPQQEQQAPAKAAPDHAQAYYHYSLAHLYEEMAAAYNRQEYLSKAIENYKLAMQYDPDSTFLGAELADLYARSGRLRDAVTEAEEMLKRNPNDLDARRLLGRIYLRRLGDPAAGKVQGEMLRRAIEQYEKIAETDDKDMDARVTLGRLYRINNDFLKAEKVLKEALQLQPESEDALTTLAFLYAETNQFQAAVDLLEKVTAHNANPRLFAALGSAYEQAHQPEKAVLAYRKALEQDKDNVEYLRALGQNLIYSEQYEDAIAPYKAVLQADPQDGNALLRLGQIYRQIGKYDLAAENLKKAGALMPDSLEVPFNQALLAESQGNTEEAIQTLKSLLDKTAKPEPATYTDREKANRAIFLERVGLLYRNSENYAEAEKYFREMLNSDQENAVRGATQVVETLRQARQTAKALSEAEALLARFPDERNLKMVHASLLAESGQVQKANTEMRALLQNKPEDREVLLAIAQMNERAKQYAEAERAVAEAAKLAKAKEEKEYVYFIWGSVLERQKKYDEAEVQFRRALEANPNSAMTLNYLGYMLADRGVRLEEAKRYIEKALARDPQNGAYLDSLGWVYFKMNRLEQAEEYLVKALQRISRDATIYDHLGDVYYQAGRIRDAFTQWQKAVSEMNRGGSTESEGAELAKIQKKLEDARIRLAEKK